MSLESARTVLIADDETNLRKVLAALLRREGFSVLTASDGEEALALMERARVDLLITDLRMPKLDGMGLLRRLQDEHKNIPTVVLTAHGTVDLAVEAMKLGAFDFMTKPFDKDELRMVINKAAATAELSHREPHHAPGGRYGLIGESTSLQDVFRTIEKVASTPSTVLITGESGTGKELVAAALHHHSPRKGRPFIRINCAAIPKDLIESELFGYEKGAFTGAVSAKPGRFELADQGTLFLDEIGEVPLEMQVKLLRALQESEFERVGGVSTTKVDVRLVAATNRDLKEEIAAGRFREDLFYRLNVVPIVLPPLRDRIEDIPLLVEHFRAKYNERLQKRVEGASSEAIERLQNYTWPGNIRELENVMERAILFAEGGTIQAEELPEQILKAKKAAPELPVKNQPTPIGPLKEIVRQHTESVEKELIQRALEETGGNVTKAARRLSISRKSLQNKMKEFGLREQLAPEDAEHDSNPPG
jgi:DNA-binding NtrC family response regulator